MMAIYIFLLIDFFIRLEILVTRVSSDGPMKLLYCTVLDFNYEPKPVIMVILV